jgi:hypothetical protein
MPLERCGRSVGDRQQLCFATAKDTLLAAHALSFFAVVQMRYSLVAEATFLDRALLRAQGKE